MNKQTARNNHNKNTLSKNVSNKNSSQAISKQKQRTGSAGTANSSHYTRIQSESNDVFNFSDSADENDDKFILKKNKNTFAPLSNDDTTAIGNIENDCTPHDNSTPSDEQNNKRKLPPPIYGQSI
ncbi:hypothetical protein QTP88_002920 [Uroleucon formosanum]